MTPAVGAVAWWGASAYGVSSYGHVAWVSAIDGDTVTVEEYNGAGTGLWGRRSFNKTKVSGYIHFKDLDGNSSGGGSIPSKPEILAVKRTAAPDGTRQVYAATKNAVTEGWWKTGPNSDGVHTSELINIAQGNIVGFDKVNLPDGKQALYTAVPDGVWETWWDAGHGPSSNKIVSGLSGVRQVIAYNAYEAGQFVHHLYVLAQQGPYEVWWKDGGDGVRVSLLDAIANPVTMTKSVGPAGTEQLYVATPTWVYELWWWPGSSQVHTSAMLNITQGDIRSLSKGDNIGASGQLLYTGTSTTAWQSYWSYGTGISNGTIATNQANAIQIKKTVTSGTHQLYLATGDHVQEYWWNDSGSGGGTLIHIAQNDIRGFDKVTDGADQQLYTASGDLVYETWWRSGVGPSTSVLMRVAR